MPYQVLARKWRPQDFSAVVGQEPIVTALSNALADGRISQAYLFSGIRGIGKTSVARIFAKALNCVHGPTPTPCNECEPCREITQGNDLDVFEIDAATYSKVEQVRELTESLRYGPARDRYKVVILDEVHRLSRQAFDALLKIIEEPPSHLVFVFATTELEAVPATILSRCQEFNFRRVPLAAMTEHLKKLAHEESIAVSPGALASIARAGEGSVRDAVALLDQLATFGSGTITDDAAAKLVGGVGSEHLERLLEAVLAGDSQAVVTLVDDGLSRGFDPRRTFADLLAYCRDALHLALDDSLPVELPGEAAERLKEIARHGGYENLLRLLNHLLASEASIRRSEVGGLALEIALLRAAELPKLVRVEEILGRIPEEPSPARRTPPQPEPSTRPDRQRTADPAAAETPDDTTAPDPPETPPPASDAAPPEDDSAPPVARFLEQVSLHKQALAAHLNAAHALEFADGELRIQHKKDDGWLPKKLERSANRQLLDRAVKEVWGEDARWRLLAVNPSEGAATEQPTSAPTEAERGAAASDGNAAGELSDDPAIQTVLDIFGGRIEGVDRIDTAENDRARQEDESA